MFGHICKESPWDCASWLLKVFLLPLILNPKIQHVPMSGCLWSAAHVSIKEVELSSAAIFHERKPDCLRVLAQAFRSTTHPAWRRNLSKYHRSPCWVHFETTARDVRRIPRKSCRDLLSLRMELELCVKVCEKDFSSPIWLLASRRDLERKKEVALESWLRC